jgi:hypothetical protein
MSRTQRLSWLVPLIAGAIVGYGLYQFLAPTPAGDLAVRDLRKRETAPVIGHRAPSLEVTPRDEPERPGVGPSIELAPRAASEWQGMLVNTTFQASCDTSSRCGLAMACHAGRCGACTQDAQCGSGEVCSMQHCVSAPNAACRARSDCPISELCMLTGYSDDARGNGDMRAYCSGSPPALARTVESDAAELAELAQAEAAPLSIDNPGTPEGLLHLLQSE